MSQYPARINVSQLDGTNGFVLAGEMNFQYSGWSLSSADINGDGFDDVIIGAPGDGASGSTGGKAYVVFGKASGFTATFPLTTLNGTNGFEMVGGVRGYGLGISVSSAGDVNGDGIEDFIVGAHQSEPYIEGAAYVVFGTEAPFSQTFDFATLDGTNGFKIVGPGLGIEAGFVVSSGGDVNGDGFDDVIVTTIPQWDTYTGLTYVVFGSGSELAATLNLSNLNGVNGFQIVGMSSGWADRAAGAGDINGDGFDDIVVGGFAGDGAFVVFGKETDFSAGVNAASLNGKNGFRIPGLAFNDTTGYSIGAAGDVNGDGFDDFFVGAPRVILEGTNVQTGAGYVVFGTSSGFPSTFSLSSLNGTNGFKIRDEVGLSGQRMSSVGDVNGDGFDDIAVSFNGVTTDTGQGFANSIYVIFGKASGFWASMDLSSLDGSNGFAIDVPHSLGVPFPPYITARTVSSGDINGDGLSDVIIGNTAARFMPTSESTAGATYVVFGHLPDAPVIRVGTVADQTLAGGDFADTLAGLAGQDQLFGNGGNDRLIGGADADALSGGSGADIFAFTSFSDLDGDLITDFDAASDRIDLTAISGETFIGTAAFTNVPWQMRYVFEGNRTILQIDRDADGIADAFLNFEENIALSGSNFVSDPGPQLSSSTPSDNAANVAVGGNIVLTFDRNVSAGSGNIEIRRSPDSSVVRTISITDAGQVSFSGNIVTINPTADLLPGTSYYVAIGPDAIHDSGGRSYAGLWNPADLNFSTAGVADTTAPTLVNRSPADNAANVALGSNIVLTFSETVVAGSGNITIYHANNGNFGGYLFAGISASDTSQVTFSGNTVTINPSSTLLPGEAYYVLINPGVIKDAAGNNFAGIASSTAFNFSTAGASLQSGSANASAEAGAVSDVTPPTLLNASIANNATGVAIDTTLTLTFSEPVKPASLGGMGFVEVGDPYNGMNISPWDTDLVTISGNVVTITLPKPFDPSTTYQFNLGNKSFADLSDNLIVGPLTLFQFTTAATPPDYVEDYTALLSGFSWNEGVPQKPTIITYSFETNAAAYSFDLTDFTPAVLASFQAFNNTEKNLARAALAQWADISGIIFLEASPGLGDIQFAKYNFSLFENESLQEAAAFAYLPTINSDASLASSWQYFRTVFDLDGQPFFYGNVYVDTAYPATTNLLLHEIGHAIGLKHPFDEGPILDPDLDNTSNTVMSYTGVISSTLQAFDIAAVQHLYGLQSADGTHLTSWSWNANTLTQIGTSNSETIRGVYSANIISGGNGNDLIVGGPNADTLNGGAQSDRLFGDDGNDTLQGGSESDVLVAGIGNDQLFGDAGNDFLYGELGNDILNGGAGSDTLKGGEGNDTIDGGLGLDSAVFSRARSDFTITFQSGGKVLLTDTSGSNGSDTLTNVELLVFQDQTITVNVPLSLKSPTDHNNDMKSDLLWQNDDGRAAVWLLNGGNPIGSGFVGNDPGPGWHIVGAADFNNDGKSDILWENDHSRAAVWLLNGTNILFADFIGNDPGAGWHIKATGDFNGDGKADVLWQNDYGRAAVWLLNGTSLVTSSFVGGDPGASWHIKGSGDFNGDGKSDILWQHNDGRAMVWLLNGTNVIGSGELGNPGAGWQVIGSGDFNGDGKSDVLWQNDEDRAAVWLIDGTNRLDNLSPAYGSAGDGWYVKGTGDFNGDGSVDILRQNVTGQAQILFMDGVTWTGTGTLASNPGAAWTIANYGVGSLAQQRSDFNGDGLSDVLWQKTDGTIAAWLIDNTQVIDGSTVGTNTDTAWHVEATGDFNGDGKWDALWQHTDGTARIWFLNALTHTGGGTVGNPGADWDVKATGDFNADGKSDILWQNTDGRAAVWLMDNLTILNGNLVGSAPGAGWEIKGSGDFNGDGKSDILWENVDGRAAVWLLDGWTVLDARAVGGVPGAGWHIEGSGDFNGDGNSDVLWQNTDGRAAVWLLDGVELIGADVVGDNADVTQQIKGAADYNGDGKSDILWLNDDGQAEIWFMDGLTVANMELIGGALGSTWSFDWA